MDIPEGERRVWFSRASNAWLHALALLAGVVAVAAALAAVAGLGGAAWPLLAVSGVVCVATLGCSSVQARVDERGFSVSFGPLALPTRHWPLRAVESARAEHRTALQAGGWGYRLSGLGTTVMLRSGPCLVVRTDKGAEFAVSVDDAERGAALLNSLAAAQRADGAR
ncbi:hypothetical protein GPJ59_33300 [Streptomyces bambusae]|uniref:DUF3093 domain-containing protein n=1 Tax=Streptomyces bambusae TaxID=1550616 RepID=A0ABS6ZFR4_9ACTN|nr:hypothetical protein [Streptomyces bambusae]